MKSVITSSAFVDMVVKELAGECRGIFSPTLFDERDKQGFKLAYYIYDYKGKLYASVSIDDRVKEATTPPPARLVSFRSLPVGSVFCLNGIYYSKLSETTYYSFFHRATYTAQNLDKEVELI